MTVEYLSRKLCEAASLRQELDNTWHFILSTDADEVRLNEGWLAQQINYLWQQQRRQNQNDNP